MARAKRCETVHAGRGLAQPSLNTSSLIQSSIDADLQRFFKEYFVDTDLDDDDVEFESFTPEDIRGLPVHLINSCRNRPIASESAT